MSFPWVQMLSWCTGHISDTLLVVVVVSVCLLETNPSFNLFCFLVDWKLMACLPAGVVVVVEVVKMVMCEWYIAMGW